MGRKSAIALATIGAGLIAIVCWTIARGERNAGADSGGSQAEAPTRPEAATQPLEPVDAQPDVQATQRATAESAPQAAAEVRTMLSVLVVGKTTRAPLAGIRVTAAEKALAGSRRIENAPGSRGALYVSPVTDASGRAEIDVPAGVDVRLSTNDPAGNAGPGQAGVTSLRDGERREIVIELAVGNDLRFFGRILARDDRAPIAGASVLLEDRFGRGPRKPGARSREDRSDLPYRKTTDADGRFDLDLASWKRPYLQVEATGFGPMFVLPDVGHDTPQSELVVLLDRAASIDLRLVDGAQAPVGGVSVEIATESYQLQQPRGAASWDVSLPDPDWAMVSDAGGRCLIADLPPGVPLRAEARRGSNLLHKEAQPLILEPGVTRLTWTIAGGCRLTGRVVDQGGAAVGGKTLWLLRPDSGAPKALSSYEERLVVARAKTDTDGSYEMKRVAAGDWWIGCAPTRNSWQPADDDAIAPLAIDVNVPDGVEEFRKDLVVQRGIYIRGRVVDPEGRPAARANVMTSAEATGFYVSADAGEDGAFAAGPLVAGRYHLRASGMGQHAPSESVDADAGDTDVVLKLRTAGTLSGSVVDAETGAPCRAEIRLSPRSAQYFVTMARRTQPDGTFRFEGMLPDTYDLSARTDDARTGCLRGVQVTAGADSNGHEIRVVRGARVTIRNEGKSKWGSFTILADGVAYGSDGLQKGTSTEQVSPAGHVTVRMMWRDPVLTKEQELDLAPGEEREVVFKEDE